MKKTVIPVLLVSSVMLISGCGDTASGHTVSEQNSSVNAVLEAGILAEDSGNAANISEDSDHAVSDQSGIGYERQSGVNDGAPEPEEPVIITDVDENDIDVDLTIMSSTVVYSQVYDMMCYPEEYIGMTVKMTGIYVCTDPEISDEFYCACIIQDATACCAQGIEFELTDDYVFPDDYPEYEDTVTVAGTFDIYKDGGLTYCTLRNAKLLEE